MAVTVAVRWRVAHGPWNADLAGELAFDTLTFSSRADGHDTVTVEATSFDQDSALIEEYVTDLHVWRGDEFLFRGRCGPVEDEVGDDGQSRTSIPAVEYAALLDRFILWDRDRVNFDLQNAAEVIRYLVQRVQGRGPDYNLGITTGVTQGTWQILTERDFEPGQSIGQIIDGLAKEEPGIEYRVRPTLELDLWTPRRFSELDVTLEHGANVRRVRRAPADGYANTLRYSGKEDVAAVMHRVRDDLWRRRGAWEASEGDTSLIWQSQLNARARGRVQQMARNAQEWAAELMPGWWEGSEQIEVGDVAYLRVNAGRMIGLDRRVRVREVRVQVEGATMTEKVTIGLEDAA